MVTYLMWAGGFLILWGIEGFWEKDIPESEQERKTMLPYILWGVGCLLMFLRMRERVNALWGLIGLGIVVVSSLAGIAVITGNTGATTWVIGGWLVSALACWRFIAGGCLDLESTVTTKEE